MAEVEYTFFQDCYRAYNKGQDDFPQELDQLYWDMIDAKGVNEDHIEQLKEKMTSLQLEQKKIQVMNEEAAKVQSDIKGLQDYLEKQQKYFHQKQIDLKMVTDNVKNWIKKKDQLEDSIAMLENECRAKGIDPKHESNHAHEVILALTERVEAKKVDLHEADKLKWQFEQNISKKTAILDQLQRDFNLILIDFDNTEDANRLRRADITSVPSLIHELKINYKEETQRLQKNIEDLEQSFNVCTARINEMAKEEKKAGLEEQKLKQEKIQVNEEIINQKEDLSNKLKQAKDRLASFSRNKSKLGHNLKDKEVDLEMALRDLQDLKLQFKDVQEQGRDFLQSVLDSLEKKKVQQLQRRQQAFEDYEKYAQALSKAVKKSTDNIRQKINKM